MTAPAASPWGSSGGMGQGFGARPKRPPNPTQQTTPSGSTQTPANAAQGTTPTFAQMQQSGQARPAPPQQPPPNPSLVAQTTQALQGTAQGTAPTSPGNLPAQTSAALGMPNANGQVGAQSQASGTAIPPASPAQSAQPPTGLMPSDPANVQGNVPSASFNPASVAAPLVDQNGQLTSAVQSALQNPNPYSNAAVQAQEAAGQATLNQQFAAQQKALDEQMAARGIGASSLASGYYGDLAGQQATAEAGLQSDILTNQAQQYQQGLATALGAGNQLAAQQAGTNLGAAQLGTQASLGAGSLGLGQQQLAQQGSQFTQSQAQQLGEFGTSSGLQQQALNLQQLLGQGSLNLGQQQLSQQGSQFTASQAQQMQQYLQSLAQQQSQFTTSDTTANRGLDIQNATNNNALNLQVASLLAQLGYSPQNPAGNTGTNGITPPSGSGSGGGAVGGSGGGGGSSGGGSGGGTLATNTMPANQPANQPSFSMAAQPTGGQYQPLTAQVNAALNPQSPAPLGTPVNPTSPAPPANPQNLQAMIAQLLAQRGSGTPQFQPAA